MRIAEVSVNVDSPPKKEKLIEMALKTGKFNTPDGMKRIEKAIKDSGLYKSDNKTRRHTSKANAKVSSRPDNTKQSNNNKRSKA